MKSPLRYSKFLVFLFFLIGSLVIGLTLNSFRLSGGEITPYRIFVSLSAISFYTVIGWRTSIRFTGTFLYKKVTSSPKPHELVLNTTYYLNGQTPATFIGMMDFTGKYLFHIQGLNIKSDPLDAKALTPNQVRDYISIDKED